MRSWVVDTNVPIVANGEIERRSGPRPSPTCRAKCIDFLRLLLNCGLILVDQAGEIEREYRRHLNPKGQPGAGHLFYLKLLKERGRLVKEVLLRKRPDGEFEDFPIDQRLVAFDRSDRKFAALACRAQAPVANATDGDWLEHREALRKHGIEVVFVCGCNRASWLESDGGGRGRRRRGG